MHQPIYSRKANGKLLLTGEYLVLDGANALAIPTCFGQTMTISKSECMTWEARDVFNEIWMQYRHNSEEILDLFLNDLFKNIGSEHTYQSFEFKTKVDFPREWGLGTSSTLIALIADFYKVNPYILNSKLFSGSGYDIACAFASKPITYQVNDFNNPNIQEVELKKIITDCIYFVYLGEKQNSKEEIRKYHSTKTIRQSTIDDVSRITQNILENQTLDHWIEQLEKHEELISKAIGLKKISETKLLGLPYFSKSLGAWGGDFAMILTNANLDEVREELMKFNLETVISYDDMIFRHH